MTNENEIIEGQSETGDLLTQPPDLPAIAPKPGWQTSEGQITGILSAALMVLAFLGFHFSPEQTQSWYDLIHSIFVIIGPIAGIIALVWPYIVSRGKTKSNAINASAMVNAALAVQGSSQSQIAQLGGLGSLLGGKNWKDPERYINILKTVNSTGIIPGGKIIDQVTGGDDDDNFKAQVTEAIQTLDKRLKALEEK